MIRTIILGSCVSVQGIFVCVLSNGNIAVRVDNKVYEGKPVNAGYKQPHSPNRKGKAKAFPFVAL